MKKVRSWCGQPSDRGRLKNRTEQCSDMLKEWWDISTRFVANLLLSLTVKNWLTFGKVMGNCLVFFSDSQFRTTVR